MAVPIEERLERVEARLGEVEAVLARLRPGRLGLTVEEARAAVEGPADRGPHTVSQLRALFGRFEGPEDLAEHMRDHLAAGRT